MKTEETDKYVTSIQEVDSKRRRVFINYEPAFVLYISEIRRFNIKKDAYISLEDYEDIIDILNKRSKIRAMSLLKDRDYTRKKLFEKLKANGYPDECIEKAVQYVSSYGYIDDKRYAVNYTISHMTSKSRRVIEQSLMLKGVDADIISCALDECYDEMCNPDIGNPELDIIIKQLHSKYHNKDLNNYEQRQKVKASLYRKGFMTDNINKALDIVAGKTTLAASLQAQLACNVFHMDDFFLRPEQRTPERLRQPGGNVDFERFLTEVLRPLRDGAPVTYRPYDCRTQQLCAPVHAEARPVNLIEGSYSCHPALWDLYDLHVFLSVGPEEQHRRIAARNGEKMLPMFTNVWIPMEETYFARFQVAERADLCREN